MRAEDLYREGAESLKRAGVREYRIDAFYLMEYAAGITRSHYFAHPGEDIPEPACSAFRESIRKRSLHIPLQQITGAQEFMGFSFHVGADTLIPRQDTECLAEKVLSVMHPEDRILDLGTGSGCIIISLLRLAYEKFGRQCSVRGVGTDLSRGALETAARNRSENGLDETKLELLEGSYFECVTGRFNIIVSNPPYIRTEEINSLEDEVKLHEPRLALDGGADGLDCYRKITAEAASYLQRGGYLCFEIGCDQGNDVTHLMRNAGFAGIEVIPDLAGLDRVVIGRKLEETSCLTD